MRFSHQERINFIYQYSVLGMSINDIVRKEGHKYTTIYTIIKEYNENGRTNRQLNYKEKIKILHARLDKKSVLDAQRRSRAVRAGAAYMCESATKSSKRVGTGQKMFPLNKSGGHLPARERDISSKSVKVSAL